MEIRIISVCSSWLKSRILNLQSSIKFKLVLVFAVFLLAFGFYFQVYYLKHRDVAIEDHLVAYASQERPVLTSSEAKNENAEITVDIRGEVNHPGIYKLKSGAILDDLIAKAGGFTKNADKVTIDKNFNMAEGLVDKQKVFIPSISKQNSESPSKDESLQIGTKININTADQAELEKLDGIGPSIAKKIINARPYKRIEDIKKVSGIGEAKFAAVKDYITV